MEDVETAQLAIERVDLYNVMQPSRGSGAAQPTLDCVSDVKPGTDHDIAPGPAEDVESVAKGTKLNRGIFLPINTHKALWAHMVVTRRVLLRLKERIELRR